jgi:hypothetical protein
MRQSQAQFVRQQGFAIPDGNTCLYPALMWQPRVIGVVLAAGVFSQNPWVFLALSAALGLSALLPSHSPFDAIYNRVVAHPRGGAVLGPAPAPRRFAQALAAALALTIAAALIVSATTTAWILEGLLSAAVTLIILARFCFGSYLYSLLRPGRARNEPRCEGRAGSESLAAAGRSAGYFGRMIDSTYASRRSRCSAD